jgi:DNA-binding IclR family transcriptional regulator
MTETVFGRVTRLLAAFDEDEPSLPVAVLAARAGIPLSSAHRLVASLVAEGWLVAVGEARYAIGTRLWELGELSPVAVRLREVALPHMVRLYEATGENVHLAVLDVDVPPERAEIVFAGRITGRASVPTLGREGGRHPLHTTGVGKAILLGRDEAWLDRYLAVPLLPETSRSITDPEALRADLARARARGWASNHGEMTLGNISVAAPLAPLTGLPPAAIGVVAHAGDALEKRLAPMVTQAARELSRALRPDA